MKGLVDVALFWVFLCGCWKLVGWFFGILASRFDIPQPVGVHEIAIDHPERDEVEFSDHERDVLLVLDVTTNWEHAL